MGTDSSPSPTDTLATWSAWVPFEECFETIPTTPGVYMAREGAQGPVVYVGMAGERRGRGIKGRLTVYRSGKALASGLGEAVFDRALADPSWLQTRLEEAEAGTPLRAKQWGRLAFERADLHIRWATTNDRNEALTLERACLHALTGTGLWNKIR